MPPTDQWQSIDDPTLIEHNLIQRTITHFNQIQGTSCTSEHLASILGDDTFTQFCNDILKGNVNLENIELSEL